LNRTIIKVILLLLLATNLFADSNLFEDANKLYEQKDYQKAIETYNQIVANDIESAPLYFNLGNAYFKDGDLGHAILYYMKAKQLAPGDSEIRHNLEFAQRFSSVQMEGVELNPITSFLASLVDSYNLSFLAWGSSFIFILFMVTLIFRLGLGYNNPFVRVGLVLSLLFLMIISGLTTFKYRYEYLTQRAVIIAEKPAVYTGASESSDIELEGAPGLIVEVLDESDDFYNVLFENKRRGWIKKELVAEF